MRVQVTNFQIVKKVDIEGEGFIVIKGDSSSGKSSTIKAIYAALFNRFTSTQVRYGESCATIKLKWDKNSPLLKVVRKATGGSPLMELGNYSWSKLTRSLPKEVEQYNNLGNLDVGSSVYSLNFCTQFSKPMLLEYSQKRVMEILSASRGLDELFKVKTQLATNREKNSGAFNEVDSILNQAKAKLSQVKFLIQEKSTLFQSIQSHYAALEGKYESLSLLQSLYDCLKQSKVWESKLSLLERLQQVYSTESKLQDKYIDYHELYENLVEQVGLSQKLKVLEFKIDVVALIALKSRRKDDLMDKSNICDSILFNMALHARCKKRMNLISSQEKVLLQLEEIQTSNSSSVSIQSDLGRLLNLLYTSHDLDLKIGSCKVKIGHLIRVNNHFNTVSELNEKLSVSTSLAAILEDVDRYNARISDIENIIKNNLCPCCGRPMH